MRYPQFRQLLTALTVLTTSWSCGAELTCEGDWCGTAVVVVGADADVLLPPVTQQDVGIAVSDLLFLKLADVGPSLGTIGDADFVPVLADSWQFVDPLTLEITLRADARWHDGAPVTAEDVAFTFDVYRDTLVASTASSRLDRISSVSARDTHTAVFRFRQAYAEQFFDAVYHMRMVPKHLLDTVPRGELASHPFGRNPVGNGPLRFVRWDAGETIELEADSGFFLGRPGLRRIIWRVTGDMPTALTQLVAGEADVLNFLGGPDNVQRVEEAEHLRVVDYPSSVYGYVQFNFRDPDQPAQPHPLFSERVIRRALSGAIDRQAIVRAIFGDHGLVPPGPVSPALWIWNEGFEALPFDSAEAGATLASAGWRDSDGDGILDRAGRSLAFDLLVPTSSTVRRRAAQIIQDQLRRIGVGVTITELEFNAALSRARSGAFDAFFGSYGGEISPASVGEVWSSAAIGGFNYGGYRNGTVDRLVNEANAATDATTARGRWREAVQAIIDDAPAIWIYSPLMTAGVHTRFDNVSLRPDQWATNLWKWSVPTTRVLSRDRFGN
jgi:peptide/nickel transport system substrate-binding protein